MSEEKLSDVEILRQAARILKDTRPTLAKEVLRIARQVEGERQNAGLENPEVTALLSLGACGSAIVQTEKGAVKISKSLL